MLFKYILIIAKYRLVAHRKCNHLSVCCGPFTCASNSSNEWDNLRWNEERIAFEHQQNDHCKSISRTLFRDHHSKEYSTITTVNQIYVQKEHEINENFQQVANSKFAAGIQHLDFEQSKDSARMINRLIEEKTNKTVQNLITPSMLDEESRMILINTIHFNNNWLFPFEKIQYAPWWLLHHRKWNREVEYMCIKTHNVFGPRHNFFKHWDLDAVAVEIYFGYTHFSFVIILPNSLDGSDRPWS